MYYYGQEWAGGFLIWNRSDAYLFVKVDRRGYSVSLLEFPFSVLEKLLRVPVIPSETREFLLVLRVTESEVEHHTVKLADVLKESPGADPSKYTPVGDHIFANCPALGGLCRWGGDRFEPATEQERSAIMPQRFGPGSRLTTEDFYNDSSGWSRRSFAVGSGDHTLIAEVDDKFRVVLSNAEPKGTKNGITSVVLQRPGRPAEEIASFKAYDGTLSREQYLRDFRDLN